MEKQICIDYSENFLSIAELIKKYHKSSDTIRKILKDNNIHIRTLSENAILKKTNYKYSLAEIEQEVIDNYCNKNYGLIRSGKKFNLSSNNVKYFLNKNGIKIRNFSEAATVSNENRSYFKNNEYFSHETRDMAWLLGFLAADGNISKKDNTIQIKLSIKDIEILEKIRLALQIENPITTYTTKDGFDVCCLRWSSKQQKHDLSKYSIVPNKTYILQPPFNLNRKYWIDYIRGYFDGDGSINLIKNSNGRGNGNLRWQICSINKEFLEWIVNYLYEDYNITKVNVLKQDKNRKQPIYYFQYSSVATRQIYNILYNESQMFLKRKKEHFEEILAIVKPLYKETQETTHL